jgi:acyl carrier protein
VLAAIAESLPPLAGVVHCAGVLDDGVLMQQSWPRFAGVLAPKVQGAWMLHQLTRALPLDFFVLYSSLASLFGSAGQGNHAAANAFLDALACHRRGQGLPATSINWGVWSQVGIAARLAASRQEEDRAPGFQGLGAIAPQEGMELFGAILSQEIEHSGRAPAQIGVTPVAWPRYAASFAGAGRPFFARFAGGAAAAAHAPAAAPAVGKAAAPARTNGAALSQELAALPAAKRRARLIDFIKVQAGQVLGLDPQACSERAPLSDLGLDSLMAVELRNVLSQRLGLKRPLPATLVFDYPSIQAMADYLLAGVLALDTVVQPVGAVHTAGQQPAGQLASGLSSLSSAQSSTEADEPGDALLADLESLSDEEVERRLAHL